MSDALTTFFDAWGSPDEDVRMAKIKAACSEAVTYSDPRSGQRLSGILPVAAHVAAFSANAPGWTATVRSCDMVNDYLCADVAFGGIGRDGSQMAQHGTYFAELKDGKLVMIAGFVGAGAAP